MSSPLKDYRILLIDADMELAHVLKAMLNEMGFTNVHMTRSGRDAIALMRHTSFDFIITEWNTEHLDGIAMLEFLRRNPESPNPAIPVIMLTGRAEQVDVFLARDYGINEYVVKPFTARTIFSRLERIIEQPRSFVMSRTFSGPDRRARSKPPEGVAERRGRPPVAQPHSGNIAAELQAELAEGEAKIWQPDFSLKEKLGEGSKLSTFVTPVILSQAQASIDAITLDSLQWIRDNLRQLKELNEAIIAPDPAATIAADISEVALLVNSRAGTFGYSRAAEIAYKLYLFARNKLDPKNKGHQLVVQKHIEVLHVILGNQMRGNAGAVGAQIAAELTALVNKYTS